MAEMIDDELFKRLSLINQYRLLKETVPDEAEIWQRAIDTLQQYRPLDELPAVDALREYARYPFTDNDRAEMFDTLAVFQALQDAEDAGHTIPDKARLSTSFPGYDGNNEGTFYSYYSDLVEEGRRWPGLRRSNPDDLNSHMPGRDGYRRMVTKWKALGGKHRLSQADFTAIMREWMHPDRR